MTDLELALTLMMAHANGCEVEITTNSRDLFSNGQLLEHLEGRWLWIYQTKGFLLDYPYAKPKYYITNRDGYNVYLFDINKNHFPNKNNDDNVIGLIDKTTAYLRDTERKFVPDFIMERAEKETHQTLCGQLIMTVFPSVNILFAKEVTHKMTCKGSEHTSTVVARSLSDWSKVSIRSGNNWWINLSDKESVELFINNKTTKL